MSNSVSLRRPLSILFLIVATELIGFGLIIPVLPQLALQFEVNKVLIGILMGAYSFAQFIASPILGALSDRYGRKIILVISKLGTAVAYLIMAKSESYELFLVARLFDGFTGGNIAVARAYVVDITTSENRARGMAVIGISFGIGFLLGPILGGILYSDSMAYESAAWVASGLSFCASLLTILLLKEPKKHIVMISGLSKFKLGITSIKDPVIKLILFIYFSYMIIFSCFETSFSVFTHYLFNYSPQQNSWLFVYAGIISLIIQGSIIRRKFKNIALVCMLGILSIGIGLIGLSIANSLLVILIMLALLSLGIGLTNTFLPALLSLYTNINNQGQVMGMYEGIGSLSRIIGPIIAYQWIIITPRKGYFICGLILIVVMLMIRKLQKRESQKINLSQNYLIRN